MDKPIHSLQNTPELNALIAEQKRLDKIVFDAIALTNRVSTPSCPIREHRARIEKRINEFYKHQQTEKDQ